MSSEQCGDLQAIPTICPHECQSEYFVPENVLNSISNVLSIRNSAHLRYSHSLLNIFSVLRQQNAKDGETEDKTQITDVSTSMAQNCQLDKQV